MLKLERMKPEAQRAMAITVPLLVLPLAAFLITPRVIGISRLSQMAAIRRQEVAERLIEDAAEIGMQQKQRSAVWPQSRGEQLAFLKELSRLVSASRVRLISYRPPGSKGGNAVVDATADSNQPVGPIATDVTVAGSYRSLVTLFGSLAHAGRFFAVESLEIRTDAYPRLSASFRLVRYVTPLRMAVASRPVDGGLSNETGR